MNKKKLILFPLLAFFLSSCLFDTDDDGLSNWLSDQGLPNNYNVQEVTVNDLTPISADAFLDTAPVNAKVIGLLGARSGLSHDVVFDFAIDSALVAKIQNKDSAATFLYLHLLESFYGDKHLPSGYLPIKENLKINASWIISEKMSKNDVENLRDIKDSIWFHELESWTPQNKADTTLSVTIDMVDSVVYGVSVTVLNEPLVTIELPKALVNDILKKPGYRRLQLRLSVPEASNLYRFYGSANEEFQPQFHVVEKGTLNNLTCFAAHSAELISVQEKCSDCVVLYGGDNVYDSLVVEFPSKPIMKALSDFYGDEFPYTVGDSNDVRQAVVMAELTFFRDDSKGESELGLPVMVVASSYVDSVDASVLRGERYKLNRPLINASGHPNMVFHEGDSLSLQVTIGMRNFINKASDGRTFKMAMRLAQSILLPKDSSYRYFVRQDTIYKDQDKKEIKLIKTDTIPVNFPYSDYARYDFTSIRNKPATLKLWLASKRGDKTAPEKLVGKDGNKSESVVIKDNARGGK